jgi:hypothetical protein
MSKHLWTAAAAAIAIAIGSTSYAQAPPGTDRPGGEPGAQSAYPKMQKSRAKTAKVKKQKPSTVGRGTRNPTPRGTGSPQR